MKKGSKSVVSISSEVLGQDKKISLKKSRVELNSESIKPVTKATECVSNKFIRETH